MAFGNGVLHGTRDEKILIIGTLLLLGFVYLSISSDVGNLLHILVAVYGFIVLYQKRPFQFIKKIDRNSFLTIGASFIGWAVLSFILAKVFYPSADINSIQDLASIIMTHTNLPVLSNNPLVILLIWGVVFPAVETMGLVAGFMVFWSAILHINLKEKFNIKNQKHWFLAVLVGVCCSLYHLIVRQGESFALFSDFIFFGLSVILSMRKKQLFEAFGLHGIINSVVLMFGGR